MQINGQQVRVAPHNIGDLVTQTANVAGTEFEEVYEVVTLRGSVNLKTGTVKMFLGHLVSTERPELSRPLGSETPLFTDAA